MDLFAALCEKLRRHDPDTTSIEIDDDANGLSLTDSRAYQLGVALLGNKHVTNVCLQLDCLTPRGDYHTLLHAIQNCKGLRDVRLTNSSLASVSHQFLRSIAHNKGIDDVRLNDMLVGADSMSLLLRGANSMQTLELTLCQINNRNGFDIHDVATDLSEHQSIDTLDIDCAFGLFQALHGGIALMSTLGRLSIHGQENIDAELQAIDSVLMSSSSALSQLLLVDYSFRNGVDFDRVAQGIRAHPTLQCLFMIKCTLNSASAHQLMSIYQTETSNVKDLSLLSCYFESPDLLAGLMRQSPHLKALNLGCSQGGRGGGLNYAPLLRCLEGETPVEHFQLHRLCDETCRALIEILPGMQKVKQLCWGLDAELTIRKEDLLRAFEKNSSLVEATFMEYSNFFNADDVARIRVYGKRNEQLPLLLESPTSIVPLYLRPQLFGIAKASHTGPLLVFRNLLRLGGAIGPTKAKRTSKRRRKTEYNRRRRRRL